MAIIGRGNKGAPVVTTLASTSWTLLAADNADRLGTFFQNQGSVNVRVAGLTGSAGSVGIIIGSGKDLTDTLSRDAWYGRCESSTCDILTQPIY